MSPCLCLLSPTHTRTHISHDQCPYARCWYTRSPTHTHTRALTHPSCAPRYCPTFPSVFVPDARSVCLPMVFSSPSICSRCVHLSPSAGRSLSLVRHLSVSQCLFLLTHTLTHTSLYAVLLCHPPGSPQHAHSCRVSAEEKEDFRGPRDGSALHTEGARRCVCRNVQMS